MNPDNSYILNGMIRLAIGGKAHAGATLTSASLFDVFADAENISTSNTLIIDLWNNRNALIKSGSILATQFTGEILLAAISKIYFKNTVYKFKSPVPPPELFVNTAQTCGKSLYFSKASGWTSRTLTLALSMKSFG